MGWFGSPLSITAHFANRHCEIETDLVVEYILFIAGPGGFAVYLGQRQLAMGPVTLYEFDFEEARGGGYEAALSFPVAS